MPLLKRHSRPTRDLHNTAKQCQCANCSADADTPHQARHHNVPVYLSFFLHLPFILFPFPAFSLYFISSCDCTFLQLSLSLLVSFPYYEICALHKSKRQHACRWLWHSNSQQRRKLRQYENAAMQATEYITSHDASQHNKNLHEWRHQSNLQSMRTYYP